MQPFREGPPHRRRDRSPDEAGAARFRLPSSAAWICLLAIFLIHAPAAGLAKERRAAVTVDVKLNVPPGAQSVRLWIPYPMSDGNQDIADVAVTGNFTSSGVYREPNFGNAILFAEWKGATARPAISYTFTAARREVVTKAFPSGELPVPANELRRYLASTSLGGTQGAAQEYASKITRGKETILDKARALYDWTVDNMYRDPDVKGCGLGEVDVLLGKLGGKCADIHSVFVTLARAAGIPAREVFGIRLPKGKEGDMTKAQHCWAEFYEPGYGWVVVDPADVRKAILEKKITVEEAKPLREYYFGAADESRIAFGTGRDIVLNPPQAGRPLNYFMYPYAETDGKPLNEDLYGFNVGYTIRFREI